MEKRAGAHQTKCRRTRQRKSDQDADIQAEIARLQARLKTAPSEAKMEELHGKLQTIVDNFGWEPQQEMVYGIRSTQPMLRGQNTMPKNLLAALKQLNEDFKARDIDFIFVPLVPTPQFAAHTLVDGIEAIGGDTDYYPGWTEMMIELLENDIEIVDTTEEFRAAAEDDVLVSWANDFHTGSRGRQIAADALAKRLQRYDFAQKLQATANQSKITEKSKTGTMMPQRILVVNRGTYKLEEHLRKLNPDKKRFEIKKMAREMKGFPADANLVEFPPSKKGGPTALHPDAPQDMVEILKNKTFKFLNLSPTTGLPLVTDLVMIGDSQLHSAVYGSGLPTFYENAIGGQFRWGSKSWGGFSPPEIYLDVVSNDDVQPRVVVLSVLPKYFWHSYDRDGSINEEANKYKPKPLPPLSGSKTVAAPSGAITANVSLLGVSDKPTNDPSTLDYDEALMHVSAKVLDGPLKGQEIGIRYWILNDGAWTKADGKYKAGKKLKVSLIPWSDATAKDRKLGQHQVFDTLDQDLTVPIYWAEGL